MLLTLGLTGMDQSTEAALKSAFAEAQGRVGAWTLVAENDADVVIVDMDSMYGPMSWLRLHAAGKRVVGLTAAPRTQADYRLSRPFDAFQLAALLNEISPQDTAPVQEAPAPAPALASAPAPAAPPAPVAVVEPPAPAPVAPPPAPEPPAPPPAVVEAPAAVVAPPQPAPTPEPVPPPPAPVEAEAPVAEAPPAAPRSTPLSHWLRPGALTGQARLQKDNGPVVYIDFSQRTYHGPATLKPLAGYFTGSTSVRDFEQIEGAVWAAETAKLGEAQPLNRLQWYGGLLAGEGRMLGGYDVEARYVLTKWPQTEREFPRHFRIATAMMKGPSTVAEVAAASGVPVEDVIDFLNANLTTGFADVAPETPPATEPAAKQGGGLLDRLRGR